MELSTRPPFFFPFVSADATGDTGAATGDTGYIEYIESLALNCYYIKFGERLTTKCDGVFL
jgi:hypothetical protein